jgi:FixJ family two-component response regulator
MNPPRGTDPLVLILNSDRSASRWIEATVTSVGLRALSFDSAAELLSKLNVNSAVCAILDVLLPDTSGFELQDKLAQSGASVLFITKEHCFASCVRAIKAGAVDFLTIPCEAKEVVRALGSAVRLALSNWAQRERLSELRSRHEKLTRREREVFELVCSGLLNKQIAERMDITEVTVQIHRGRVMKKMSARSFAALVRMADALQPAPTHRIP